MENKKENTQNSQDTDDRMFDRQRPRGVPGEGGGDPAARRSRDSFEGLEDDREADPGTEALGPGSQAGKPRSPRSQPRGAKADDELERGR
jgi:hypothetical protein